MRSSDLLCAARPYTVADATFERVRVLADQLDIRVHLHTHETARNARTRARSTASARSRACRSSAS
jgi:cytosine/adenosine deaminase-related metal-dependent hydrolase